MGNKRTKGKVVWSRAPATIATSQYSVTLLIQQTMVLPDDEQAEQAHEKAMNALIEKAAAAGWSCSVEDVTKLEEDQEEEQEGE